MKELMINQNDAGQRLDKFLSKCMPALPHSLLYKGLRKNCVRINGKHVKDPQYQLKEGDVAALYFKNEFFVRETVSFLPVKPELSIVYEDENLLILDKKPGISVHGEQNNSGPTLIDHIKSYLFEKGEYDPEKEHSFSPSLANRLDRNTGGLLLCAKNAPALRVLNQKLKNREIKKWYLCLTEGTLSPKEGVLEGWLLRGDKKVTVTSQELAGAKSIRTGYRVLQTYSGYALTEVALLTGRTHQIRAHLASAGHPLAGDTKYGAKKDPRFPYQLLYSCCIKFDFTAPAGVLDYLAGKEVRITPDLFSMHQ